MAKILIVDDRPPNRDFLTALLRDSGHSTIEASNGREALEVARREHPDLAIVDLLMPVMDGYEFVKHLRSEPAIAATRIIFQSAIYNEDEMRRLAEATGVGCILPKPSEPQVILRVIDDTFRREPIHNIAAPLSRQDVDPHVALVTNKLVEKVNELEMANLGLAVLGAELEKRVADRTAELEGTNARLQLEIIERKAAEWSARSSRERLDAAIDAAQLGTWEWDLASGRITWGGHHEQLFGMGPGEFDGTYDGVLKHVHPEDREILNKAVQIAQESRSEYATEFRVILKDGSTRWIASRGRYQFDEAGAPLRMTGAVWDITERRRTQEALTESTDHLRLAIQGAGIGIWRWDVARDEVVSSQECIALFGLGEHDKFTSLADVVAGVHPDDRARFGKILEEAMACGSDYDSDFRVVWPNGTIRWLSTKGTVLRDRKNHTIRLQGVTFDITERHLAAERLNDAKKVTEEFNLNLVALDEINQSLMKAQSIDELSKSVTDGLVQKFDAFFARLWLKRPGDRCATCALASHCPLKDKCLHLISSSGFYTHIDGDHQRVPLGAFKIGLIAQGRGRTISNDVVNDERVHDHEWAAKHGLKSFAGIPLRRGDEIIGVVAMFSRNVLSPQFLEVLDLLSHSVVTAITNVEQQAHLIRASHAKGEFLANMSHELRTPLNGVIGMMDLLLQTKLDAGQRRYALLAKSSGDMLLSLVNDILDFSKIEAGRLDLECIGFDLHDSVENVGACLASRASSKGLEFLCVIHRAVPRLVMGDSGRLQQILTNLIANAIKFTDHGHVTVRVTKEEETERDKAIRFTVSDTGIGIPNDRVHRLFESFSQIDSSMTRKFGGTGLGLAISKRLVKAMGGEIGVSSVEGEGSTFWFVVRFLKHPENAKHPFLVPAEIRRVRVLIVDDNPASREVLTEQFTGWEIEHEVASAGSEAIAILRKAQSEGRPFGIAVIDRDMPGMNGLQLAQTIKDDSSLAPTILVLLTSGLDDAKSDDLVNLGFAGWLAKPARPSQLLDTLTESLVCTHNREDLRHLKPAPSDLMSRTRKSRWAGEMILLAEDHEIGQQVAHMVLTNAGFRCEIVSNGRDAVEYVKAGKCALVLMDCQMPLMDGFQATEAIRSYENELAKAGGPSRRIPIIALTANAIQGDRERCLAAGMDDYISKPLDAERLLQLIDDCLDSKNFINQEVPFDDVPGGEPAHHEEKQVSTAFDENMFSKMWGNDEPITKNILQRFCELIPGDFEKLQEAIANQDAQETERLAHGLKGAAGYVAAEGIRKLAAELEIAASHKQLAELNRILKQLNDEFGRCFGEMRNWSPRPPQSTPEKA